MMCSPVRGAEAPGADAAESAAGIAAAPARYRRSVAARDKSNALAATSQSAPS